MHELVELIREAALEDGGPSIERVVFGTDDPDAIAAWYGRCCEHVLGSPLVGAGFYAPAVGCVVGVELADGRSLSMKAYQGRWRLGLLRLVSGVQRRLAAGGFPCPMPELEPLVFEGITVSVEQVLEDPGMRVLGPGEMEISAAGLAKAARILSGRDLAPWAGLHAFVPAPGALYPEPHSPLFDFSLDEEEVAWVDELASAGAAARDRAEAGDRRLGLFHCDWAARNIRIAGGRLVASYDWDSLNARSESTAVGNAAATWRSTGEPDDPPAPGPTEIDDYLDAYVRAAGAGRGPTGTRTWRKAAMGQALWILAYTARCEHALEARDPDVRARRARDTLEAEGAHFLEALAP